MEEAKIEGMRVIRSRSERATRAGNTRFTRLRFAVTVPFIVYNLNLTVEIFNTGSGTQVLRPLLLSTFSTFPPQVVLLVISVVKFEAAVT